MFLYEVNHFFRLLFFLASILFSAFLNNFGSSFTFSPAASFESLSQSYFSAIDYQNLVKKQNKYSIYDFISTYNISYLSIICLHHPITFLNLYQRLFNLLFSWFTSLYWISGIAFGNYIHKCKITIFTLFVFNYYLFVGIVRFNRIWALSFLSLYTNLSVI